MNKKLVTLLINESFSQERCGIPKTNSVQTPQRQTVYRPTRMQHLGLISRKQKTVTVGQSVDCNASTHSSAPPHCARCTLYCLHTLLLKSSLCLCLCVLVFASVFVFVFVFVCRWVLRLDSTLQTLHFILYTPFHIALVCVSMNETNPIVLGVCTILLHWWHLYGYLAWAVSG